MATAMSPPPPPTLPLSPPPPPTGLYPSTIITATITTFSYYRQDYRIIVLESRVLSTKLYLKYPSPTIINEEAITTTTRCWQDDTGAARYTFTAPPPLTTISNFQLQQHHRTIHNN
jgi:hypothetical protein